MRTAICDRGAQQVWQLRSVIALKAAGGRIHALTETSAKRPSEPAAVVISTPHVALTLCCPQDGLKWQSPSNGRLRTHRGAAVPQHPNQKKIGLWAVRH